MHVKSGGKANVCAPPVNPSFISYHFRRFSPDYVNIIYIRNFIFIYNVSEKRVNYNRLSAQSERAHDGRPLKKHRKKSKKNFIKNN